MKNKIDSINQSKQLISNFHKIYSETLNVLLKGNSEQLENRFEKDGGDYNSYFKSNLHGVMSIISLISNNGDIALLSEDIERDNDKKSKYPKNLLNSIFLNIIKFDNSKEKLNSNQIEALNFLKQSSIMIIEQNPLIVKNNRIMYLIDLGKNKNGVLNNKNKTIQIPGQILSFSSGLMKRDIERNSKDSKFADNEDIIELKKFLNPNFKNEKDFKDQMFKRDKLIELLAYAFNETKLDVIIEEDISSNEASDESMNRTLEKNKDLLINLSKNIPQKSSLSKYNWDFVEDYLSKSKTPAYDIFDKKIVSELTNKFIEIEVLLKPKEIEKQKQVKQSVDRDNK